MRNTSYLIDNTNLFVGSANCTANGLKLYDTGNIETLVELEATDDDKRFIQTIIDQSDVIDFETLQQMKEHVSSIEKNILQDSCNDWPTEIFQQNSSIWRWATTILTYNIQWFSICQAHYILWFQNDSSPVPSIWVSDLFWNSPEKLKDSDHDMSMLNISLSSSTEEISEALVKTKIFKWLYGLLEDTEKGELYFGSLIAKLHDQLCDDPIPYRKNVKSLLVTLLSYCNVYAAHLVKVDCPKHSQRISLIT